MTDDRRDPDPHPLAAEMFAELVRDGQSARRVVPATEAQAVREGLRRLGRTARVRLRTARMDDAVVAARLDAALWTDDTATMRRKLALDAEPADREAPPA